MTESSQSNFDMSEFNQDAQLSAPDSNTASIEEDTFSREKLPHTLGSYVSDFELSPKDLSGKKVLDVGAGLGKFAREAKALYDIDVISLDQDPRLHAEIFREPLPNDVPFIEAAMFDLPVAAESLDYVFARAVMLETFTKGYDDIDRVINEAVRVLKPQGKFVFGPGPILNLYDEKEYTALSNKSKISTLSPLEGKKLNNITAMRDIIHALPPEKADKLSSYLARTGKGSDLEVPYYPYVPMQQYSDQDLGEVASEVSIAMLKVLNPDIEIHKNERKNKLNNAYYILEKS